MSVVQCNRTGADDDANKTLVEGFFAREREAQAVIIRTAFVEQTVSMEGNDGPVCDSRSVAFIVRAN